MSCISYPKLALDAVLALMAPFGRIALCGMIAGYDGEPIPICNPALWQAASEIDLELGEQ